MHQSQEKKKICAHCAAEINSSALICEFCEHPASKRTPAIFSKNTLGADAPENATNPATGKSFLAIASIVIIAIGAWWAVPSEVSKLGPHFSQNASSLIHVHKAHETRKYSGCTADISYPQFTGQPAEVVQELNQVVQRTVNDNLNTLSRPSADGWRVAELSCDYDAITLTPEFVSTMLQFYSMYEGAAHGGTTLVPVNYELSPLRKSLSLEDAFGKPVDYSVLSQLCKLSLYKTLPDQDLIDQGTSKPDDCRCFTLDKNALIITYGDYQVGCYADGHPQVKLSYGELRNMFAPSSPLYQYVLQSNGAPVTQDKNELEALVQTARKQAEQRNQ